MKRLSARAPDLDIFGASYVVRDAAGWQLTETGAAFLAGLEMPAAATHEQTTHEQTTQTTHEQITSPEIIVTVPAPARQSPPPQLRLVADNPARRARGKDHRSSRPAVA
jgi:hypothetical protein